MYLYTEIFLGTNVREGASKMEQEKVLEVLMNATELLKAEQVVQLSGLERAQVDKAFKALKKDGKIESPKRCFYAAVK